MGAPRAAVTVKVENLPVAIVVDGNRVVGTLDELATQRPFCSLKPSLQMHAGRQINRHFLQGPGRLAHLTKRWFAPHRTALPNTTEFDGLFGTWQRQQTRKKDY